jgi:hypothetical protein
VVGLPTGDGRHVVAAFGKGRYACQATGDTSDDDATFNPSKAYSPKSDSSIEEDDP